MNLWVKSSISAWRNPDNAIAEILFKEIDNTFDTGSITTSYPDYATYHHSKNPSWFTGNEVEFGFDLTDGTDY